MYSGILQPRTAKREAVIPEVDNFAGEIQEKETLELERISGRII